MNYAVYRFVPVERELVVEPPVALEDISFDRPLPHGSVSGTLEVRWTAQTPICVGGGRDDSGSVVPTMIGGRHCIPGSTLRGMVRATLEAATFSHLGRINSNRHHGVREFEGLAPFHSIKPTDIKAGWLTWDAAEGWAIRQAGGNAQVVLVPVWSLLDHLRRVSGLDIDEATWRGEMSVVEKYACFPETHRMQRFAALWNPEGGRNPTPTALVDRPEDRPNDFSPFRNMIPVFTGPFRQEGLQDASDGVGTNVKRHEALFLPPSHSSDDRISIPDAWMTVFHRMHADPGRDGGNPRGAWRTWLRAFGWEHVFDGFEGRSNDEAIPQNLARPEFGIPVFWKGDPRSIDPSEGPGRQGFWFDLSRVMRCPYQYSVGEVAQRLYEDAPTGAYEVPRMGQKYGWDFARALFGEIDGANLSQEAPSVPEGEDPDRAEKALKGRVAFSMGWAETDGLALTEPRTGVFAQPRESFWPFYLVDRDEPALTASYNSRVAVPAGRKRTVARRNALPVSEWPQGNSNADTTTSVRFLESGATFIGRVRVHNMHPVELGALLWALTFGDPGGGHWHQAGRAKGLGYGALQPSVRFLRGPQVIGDCLQADATSIETYLDEFREYMSQALGTSYEDHPHIAQLRHMADPNTGESNRAHLTTSSLQDYTEHKRRARIALTGEDGTSHTYPLPDLE